MSEDQIYVSPEDGANVEAKKNQKVLNTFLNG